MNIKYYYINFVLNHQDKNYWLIDLLFVWQNEQFFIYKYYKFMIIYFWNYNIFKFNHKKYYNARILCVLLSARCKNIIVKLHWLYYYYIHNTISIFITEYKLSTVVYNFYLLIGSIKFGFIWTFEFTGLIYYF